MNLLFRVLFATGCRSTHHKLAMDALCRLRGPFAERWRNLFLSHHEAYLEGAKVPDTKFKDFRNHVLHVRENFWGGAPASAVKWYDQTVEALWRRDWKAAVFNAGVLSHYYTDPIMPFHTAQSEAENNIHRAAEWSITKSYDVIRALLDEPVGFPELSTPRRADWLTEMVKDGARQSNPYYETLIRHYDFSKGVKNPPAGLDDLSRRLLARLFGHAIVGFARILERAFDEAKVEPPEVSLELRGFLAALQIPIKWVTNKLADSKERAVVEAMYEELQKTGKVEKTLPEDDRIVRALHHLEVVRARPSPPPAVVPEEPEALNPFILQLSESTEVEPEPITLPMPEPKRAPERTPTKRPAATLSVRGLRFYLEWSSPIVDAPSIGPKTATRLKAAGVETVADLLERDAAALADKLGHRSVTEQTVLDWQDQARLVCQIPQIRGHDAQILVACNCRSPEAVARADAAELLAAAEKFVASTEGKRVIRSGEPPDLDEVKDWIAWAGQARTAKAA